MRERFWTIGTAGPDTHQRLQRANTPRALSTSDRQDCLSAKMPRPPTGLTGNSQTLGLLGHLRGV